MKALASRGFVAALAEGPDPHGEGKEHGGDANDRKAQQPRVVRACEQRVHWQRDEQSERQHEDQQRPDEERINGQRVFRVGGKVVDDLQQRPAALEDKGQSSHCNLERGDDHRAEDRADNQHGDCAERDRHRKMECADGNQRDAEDHLAEALRLEGLRKHLEYHRHRAQEVHVHVPVLDPAICHEPELVAEQVIERDRQHGKAVEEAKLGQRIACQRRDRLQDEINRGQRAEVGEEEREQRDDGILFVFQSGDHAALDAGEIQMNVAHISLPAP